MITKTFANAAIAALIVSASAACGSTSNLGQKQHPGRACRPDLRPKLRLQAWLPPPNQQTRRRRQHFVGCWLHICGTRDVDMDEGLQYL